jgi:hypothetical protein
MATPSSGCGAYCRKHGVLDFSLEGIVVELVAHRDELVFPGCGLPDPGTGGLPGVPPCEFVPQRTPSMSVHEPARISGSHLVSTAPPRIKSRAHEEKQIVVRLVLDGPVHNESKRTGQILVGQASVKAGPSQVGVGSVADLYGICSFSLLCPPAFAWHLCKSFQSADNHSAVFKEQVRRALRLVCVSRDPRRDARTARGVWPVISRKRFEKWNSSQ